MLYFMLKHQEGIKEDNKTENKDKKLFLTKIETTVNNIKTC